MGPIYLIFEIEKSYFAYFTFAQQSLQQDVGEIAPYFIRVLTNVYEADVSETLRLECKLNGSPRPQVQWYKDGRVVRADENFVLESKEDGTQSLTLRKASKADVGEYVCEATNILGKAETHTSVVVIENFPLVSEPMEISTHEEFAPEFDQELRECRVDEGQSVAFECHVLGQPAPVVHWFKDGQKVEENDRVTLEMLPDGKQRLSISEARAEDQGNYRCEATNIAGSMSSKAPLTVRVAEEMEIERAVAPEFSVPLHEVKVREGVSAHFECALSETRGVKIQWFKDGKLLSPSPEYIIECAEDGRQSLTVYKAKSENVGHYYCVATSPVGKAETEANLQVLEGVRQPEFTRGLKNVKVKSGELVALSCQIDMTKLKRLPAVKWYKNGVELIQDKRVLLTVNESGQCNMLISQTTEEDTGIYKCEISNDAGSNSCEAEVSVQLIKPPDFLSSLNDQVVNEGQNLEMEVKVSGAPFPDVKWLKDGKEIRVSGTVKVIKEEDTGTIRLVLEGIKPEDEGTYRCIVSNVHGTASAKASIEVKPKEKVEEKFEVPQFLRDLQSVHVPEGEDVALTCQISGQPTPDVIWYKGNVPIKKDDQKYTITSDENGLCVCRISNISPSDSASYTCKLVNPAGSVESSAELTVEAKIVVQPPEFKRAMQDRRTSAKSSVAFEIEVNTSDVAVQWFENGSEVNANHKHLIEQVSSTVFRLIVKDVDEKTDAGEYQCQVSNVAGTVVSKGNLFVEEERKEELIAPKFTKGLQDKKVKQGQKLVLEAEVEGKPKTVK
uniref:Ig-like domain-containing protein n=1 Tax=Romanomermis culicivorax TaxID=13658 RepID=A0A915KCF1_ROMCU